MGLLSRLRGEQIERSDGFLSGGPNLSMDEWLSSFNYDGSQYPFGLTFTQSARPEQEIVETFAGFVSSAYAANGAVFACLLARASLFSEARFQWRRFDKGRPGTLFGDQELAVLENPWPNGTTGDLLVRLEQDYSLAGNFYGWRQGNSLLRMRPDWVTIVIGSNMDEDSPEKALDARVIGYIYSPGGRSGGRDPVVLPVESVCHFTGPTPDPLARFRGMSWLQSILREVQSDSTMTSHKQRYLEHGGPNQAVTVDIPDPAEFQEFVKVFRQNSEGAQNRYKRLFFNAGTNIETVGSDMVQMDFKNIQGHGETRIASAAGVPPIIVGFSEGLDAATYSNYELAMRRFADLTARPFWRMAAGCLQSVLRVPPGAQLWYDDRDIPALKDDIVKRAEVWTKNASAAKQLVDAGYEPDAVRDAILADDWGLLQHTGLPTVQVQQNGQSNGNGSLADKAGEILTP
jgi:phage portal protein BeeE